MQNQEEQRELSVKATEMESLSKQVNKLKKKQEESEKKIEYLRAQLVEKEVMIREAVSWFLCLTFLLRFASL
jgi:septal ring factor EnvC (AmiA/AmiB activator)